ncbi:MAG: extracellular solute-binding protein, partial [Clostridiales bacterium]|nr:extracellular solute-binding protein [Clostridiales bacterium]
MRKLVSILLAMLMLTSTLAALGEELALTTEPMTITLWDIGTDDPQKTIQEGAVARFMAAYPNITVNQVHIQNDNYKQQLVVAMSSKQAPDMYIHWGGGPMAEYYKSGFVNDITDLFAKYDHPEFIDAAVAQSTYDGKVLAIPYGGLSGCDIFYNKTIFAEVGVEVPTTIAELEAVCDKLIAAG